MYFLGDRRHRDVLVAAEGTGRGKRARVIQ